MSYYNRVMILDCT